MAHLSSKGIFRIHPLAFAIAFFFHQPLSMPKKILKALKLLSFKQMKKIIQLLKEVEVTLQKVPVRQLSLN